MVISQRRMELLLLAVVFVCSQSVQSEEDVDPSIPLSVTRRLSSDLFYFYNSTRGVICDNDDYINVTYLVSERRCISNEDLFTGK